MAVLSIPLLRFSIKPPSFLCLSVPVALMALIQLFILNGKNEGLENQSFALIRRKLVKCLVPFALHYLVLRNET